MSAGGGDSSEEAALDEFLVVQLQTLAENEIAIIPRQLDGKIGRYAASDVYSVKDLRDIGVQSSFLHDSEHRTFLHEHSAALVLAYSIGVASNMSTDTVKLIWQYVRQRAAELASPDKPVTVKLKIKRLRRKDLTLEGLEIEGPLSDQTLQRLIDALTGESSDGRSAP